MRLETRSIIEDEMREIRKLVNTIGDRYWQKSTSNLISDLHELGRRSHRLAGKVMLSETQLELWPS